MAATGKVLIVDDDADLCEVMRHALESDHFEVFAAPDGRQGVQMMREHRPHLVLLDLNMGHPTEGVAMCRTISEDPELWDIPVVILMSIADSDHMGHFPVDGPLHVEQFLSKPVALREILQLANHYAPGQPATATSQQR
jgi:CheY-like chemotaxis protein